MARAVIGAYQGTGMMKMAAAGQNVFIANVTDLLFDKSLDATRVFAFGETPFFQRRAYSASVGSAAYTHYFGKTFATPPDVVYVFNQYRKYGPAGDTTWNWFAQFYGNYWNSPYGGPRLANFVRVFNDRIEFHAYYYHAGTTDNSSFAIHFRDKARFIILE